MTDRPHPLGDRGGRAPDGRTRVAAGRKRRAPGGTGFRFALAPALLVGAACCVLAGHALGTASDAAADRAARAHTRLVVAAATTFLDTLDPDQRAQAAFPFDPQATPAVARFTRDAPGAAVREMTPAEQARAAARAASGPPSGSKPADGSVAPPPPHDGGPMGPPPPGGQGMGPPGGFTGERYGRVVWSNFPVSDVPRTGLRFGSLSAPQRASALALLRTLLSPAGYTKVQAIMASDQALANEGTPFASGEDAYTIGVFGKPDRRAPWMVGFGGHHLGLNVVIAGRHGVMTPTLTGAQPSVFTSGGKTVRVLAGENDKAFALLAALDPSQRRQAILDYRVADLVLGPDHPAGNLVPEGLRASAMTPRQRAMLLDLIGEWAGMIDRTYAAPRMNEIEAGLDDTWFAWSGPTEHAPGRNGSSYYRIQGPKLVIEFAPQDTNGDPTLHVHTVYRDPTNPYGRAFTAP